MNWQRAFGYLLSLAVCFVVWKVASVLVASTILPSPEATFQAFIDTAQTQSFWSNFGVSTYRVVLSIALAWCLAFPLGIFIGYSQKMDRYFSPLIFLTYPIPKMVFLPVLILFFGLGDMSKIALITIIVFFQILISTKEGVSAVDRKYIDSMHSMNATNKDILREAIVPAALPSSFTALRIVTGTSISVLFFVEYFAGSTGLGYKISEAWTNMQYTQIFVYIIAMSILGLALYEVFTYMERRLCRWRAIPEEPTATTSQTPLRKIAAYAQMIKLSHSVFAVPFGLAALVLLAKDNTITFAMVFWVVLAIIGARSAAMGFNRVVDAAFDAKNPRTKMRHIPSGTLTMKEGLIFVIVSAAVFVMSAVMLSPLCFWLSFPVLGIIMGYSYSKRFTAASHIILGISIGLMPLGASVAVAGTIPTGIWVLSLALSTYIAGFDILYSCLDIDFDRKEGLWSLPSRYGVTNALVVSSILHVISFAALAALFWIYPLGIIFLVGVAAIAVMFVVEHLLVRPADLSKVNVAFFNVNAVISILVFASVLLGAFA
ncbi:MAG: UbiA-like polyprenyltransferase [Methanomassiliicoccales archaeon]|jgi:4-hydroxybenzoate polyprenyltransferase